MKLKYIFTALVATLAFAVGCEKEADHYLSNIQVSSSYVSLPVAGGYTDITVNATEAWTVGETPDWLTVTASTGGAEGHLRFEAGPGEGRTAEVLITCGTKTQHINVIQGIATIQTATCEQVIAGPDSKTYRVTGVCKNIYNTTYGNWHIDDGTGDVTIYGTLDAKGNTKNFLSLGIEEGDEVTVEGPKTTYNGTVELVDVTVIKINKSLIKVESAVYPGEEGVNYLPVAGGNVVVTLSNKGNNLGVEIPEDALEWLTVSALNGNEVTFRALPNEGGDREATVTFKTTDGKKDYTATLTISQKGAIVDATVAQFLAADTDNTQYRITGVITQIKNTTYGNVYIKDFSGEVYVYGIGAKNEFAGLGINEGDIVTLVGKRGEHNGTPQMTGGQYEPESRIEVTEVDIPTFLADGENGKYYRVTGTVVSIANPTYGNLTISDGTNDLYVYGTYPGCGAKGDDRKNFLETIGLQVGDQLTVFGPRSVYNDTPQVNGGLYWSHQPIR